MYNVQKLAGLEKGSLFHRECAGRIFSFVVDRVVAVQLVCLASDVALCVPVGTTAYGAIAGELRHLC